MIPVFYDMQPRKYITLKILHALIIRFVLDVKHRRQISIGKMYLLQEIISLFTSRRFIAPEMIYTTDKTKIASLIEIRTEILIQPAGALSALNDDKTHRASLNHCILKLLPIYISLIMRDIYTMNFISFRIYLITIKRTPSKTGRTYEEW